MEIIIRSLENGWETVRRMELPEDDGLVKSIIRSVKRRVNPPETAGVVTVQEVNEDQTPDPKQDTAPDPPAELQAPEQPITQTTFETGYRGFLIIRCGGCGKIYFKHAREPITESLCKACGHVTKLENMAAAELFCPDCGKAWRYRTDSEEAAVSVACIQCGREMTGEWDKKLRRYVSRK